MASRGVASRRCQDNAGGEELARSQAPQTCNEPPFPRETGRLSTPARYKLGSWEKPRRMSWLRRGDRSVRTPTIAGPPARSRQHPTSTHSRSGLLKRRGHPRIRLRRGSPHTNIPQHRVFTLCKTPIFMNSPDRNRITNAVQVSKIHNEQFRWNRMTAKAMPPRPADGASAAPGVSV